MKKVLPSANEHPIYLSGISDAAPDTIRTCYRDDDDDANPMAVSWSLSIFVSFFFQKVLLWSTFFFFVSKCLPRS